MELTYQEFRELVRAPDSGWAMVLEAKPPPPKKKKIKIKNK